MSARSTQKCDGRIRELNVGYGLHHLMGNFLFQVANVGVSHHLFVFFFCVKLGEFYHFLWTCNKCFPFDLAIPGWSLVF